jgi:hypothetical protein
MRLMVLAISAVLAQAEPPPSAPPAGVLAAPAAASTPPGSPAGTKVSRDTLLCRQEQVIGSRIPRKVCYTRNQQEQREQEDHRTMDRLQSQFGTCPTPNCR